MYDKNARVIVPKTVNNNLPWSSRTRLHCVLIWFFSTESLIRLHPSGTAYPKRYSGLP
jgi:hypothetical protein